MAKNNTAANVGFEDTLWQAADKLRGHMDPSEYKHVVLVIQQAELSAGELVEV